MIYRIERVLILDLEAAQKALAVESAGQVCELLPIKLESVLTRYQITRCDVEAQFADMEQITPFREISPEAGGCGTGGCSRLRATFRIPLMMRMETTAEYTATAQQKAGQVLSEIPDRMEKIFARFRVVGALVEIPATQIDPIPVSLS